ncbi:MAG: T9SS type A sorting domain-containing protein [Aliifodinibius sp.]|nr:T9SS type A sorting domain-containing protein [candidate division Zixibacteria bacterium]NIT54711.1 T9SS type A sorting domain-containing protein [Fodinibius sp.]NIU16677.1 T9SS type A sorting domain-containing protein [candidate division Zixibacteria bacterium]NIV14660.1 T9SS type A sorting domain-containing protein [Fodinibius sp.]NIY23295.1 T9SS type A sorting domain-containing protein [Fodinibius sp.]
MNGGVYRSVNPTVSIDQPVHPVPSEFLLAQNYPNPFNSTTVIRYALPKMSDVKLIIYNVLGQKVRTLLNDRVEAGYHSIEWDGRNDIGAQAASGIFVYRLKAGNQIISKKMLLLR